MCSLCIIEKTYYLCTVKKPLYLFLVLGLMMMGCIGYSRHETMRAGLDSINERNRNDLPFTVSDVQPYVDYFDDNGSPNDQMLAYYMLGSALRNEGNVPEALKYFRIATELADTTDEGCDYRTLSRVYGQIAVLFHMQRSPRLEIEVRKKAISNAWKAKDTIAAIIFYENMYSPYHMLNKIDSVLYYSQRAASMFKEIGRTDLAARSLGSVIDVYLRQKDYNNAKSAMDEYEQNSLFFDQSGNIEKGKESYYNYKGMYYEGVHRMDSAEYFYRKLLYTHPDLNTKEAAYKGLLSIYRQMNIGDSVAKYAELYCQMNDSASFAHSADEITRMQAVYNYDESERRAAKHEETIRNYRLVSVFSFLVLAVISYYIFRFIKRQKRLKRQELIRVNTEYSALLTQYNKIQQDLNLSKQDQIKFRKEKENEIMTLRKKLLLYQDSPQMINDWNIESAMLNSPIVRELHNLASKAIVPSTYQWKSFREFVEQELPDYITKLKKKEVALTYQEIIIGVLMRLQFSQTEQAALMGVSKQRINNWKRSINKKLFGEEGAISLNNNIMNV